VAPPGAALGLFTMFGPINGDARKIPERERELALTIGILLLKLVFMSGQMGICLNRSLHFLSQAKHPDKTVQKAAQFLQDALAGKAVDAHQKWFIEGRDFKELVRIFVEPEEHG
jgi:hypothetical protein